MGDVSKWFLREETEIPRVGRIVVREFSWAEMLAHDAGIKEAEADEKIQALARGLAPAVVEPEELREALANGAEDLNLAIVNDVTRKVYRINKIDAPWLEEIPEGSEHVPHVEDAAEDF